MHATTGICERRWCRPRAFSFSRARTGHCCPSSPEVSSTAVRPSTAFSSGPLERAQSQTDLTVKAAAYRVPTLAVDGMDVEACHTAAQRGVDHVRDTGGPFFIEFRTYRFRAHSMFDPELYRDKAEVALWRERDPIQSFTDKCLEDRMLSDADVREIEDSAAAEIDDAVAFAEAGTWEDVVHLERDVLTPESAQ